MESGTRATSSLKTRFAAFVFLLLVSLTPCLAASLQTFVVVFGQVTNEIAQIQSSFTNSAEQRHRLYFLTRARTTILDETLRDEQVLSRLVSILGSDNSYDATLTEAAFNARATVLARYDLIATRVTDLPPSRRGSIVRSRFNALSDERNALANAQQPGTIASQLAPFGARLESVAKLLPRAQVLPRPNVRSNAMRGIVNGRRFYSTASDRNTPNIFEVTRPDSTYRSVYCRAVDGESVVYINIPVVTDSARYEITQGTVGVNFSPDVFATNSIIMTATNGTFFVQTVRNEIYGVFTCEGPGFEIKDGRFRVTIPRRLRD